MRVLDWSGQRGPYDAVRNLGPFGYAILAVALLFAVTTITHAADTPPAGEPPAEELYLADMPLVLSASRLAQRPQDAPAAVFVIDREMIDASGAREIHELLRLAPGFLVAHDGGNRPTVGYHGLVDQYGRRMLVQIDGRAVYDPLFGGVRWADLPIALDDIQRIEVIRGSNSASYGANAFLGVVNIETRTAAASQGTYLRAAAGDPRYREAIFRHGFTRGPLEMRYTLGYQEDDGFTKIFSRPIFDSKALSLATFDGTWRNDSHDSFRLQGGIKDGDLETGRLRGSAVDPFNPPRDVPVSHRFLQLDWNRDLGADEALRVTAYTNYRDYDDEYHARFVLPGIEIAPGTFADVTLDSEFGFHSTAERHAVELEHTLHPIDGLRLVWGAELRRDEVDSTTLFRGGNPARDDMVRVFGNAEWRATDDLVFNVGGMLADHDITGTDFSPRLAVNWQAHPRHTLRLAASRSVRVPSLFEAEADAYNLVDLGLPATDGQPDAISQEWLNAQDLDSETVDNIEFGWLFDLMPEVGLRGDVKVFYERYEDLLFEYHYPLALRGDLALCDPALNPLVDSVIPAVIDAIERDRSPNAWRRDDGPACNLNDGFNNQAGLEGPESLSFANQLDIDVYGVEASLEWKPSARSRIISSYSISDTRNLEVGNPSLLDRDFTNRPGNWLDKVVSDINNSVPSHIFSALAIYNADTDLTFSAAVYHVSRTDFLEDGDTDIPSYTRFDFRAARRFRLDENWRAELYGVVQNAGHDYQDFEKKNLYDTRAFVGIKFYQ
jgi:iron complex outermembrane receptor protein